MEIGGVKVLNTEILANPLNWVTLFLMVFIAGLAIHFILSHVQFLSLTTPGGNV